MLDVHGHVSVPFGANSFLVLMMLLGTEAPGSGRAVRPETGRTSDDLVPVIGSFDFLTEEEKIKIFNDNPARVVPALAKTR